MSENGTEPAPQETNLINADATINEPTQTAEQSTEDITPENTETAESTESTEDVSYHTVEKRGKVTAIWEMQGRKHIRTIDPRSNEGKQILELFETAA